MCEHRLRMFENRVVVRISGAKRKQVIGELKSITRHITILALQQTLFGDQLKNNGMKDVCNMHGRDEKYTQRFERRT